MRKSVLFFAAGVLAAALATPSRAQTVLQRKRLGNNSEATTAIHAGPLSRGLAIMDGLDVRFLPNEALGTAPPLKLFNVLGLGVTSGPRGIAHIDTQGRFVFDDPTQINTLFLSGDSGVAQGTINITRLGGFTPDHVEGLVWLPPTAAQFGGDLIEVAETFGDTSTESRLEVIDPGSGNVVAEIFPVINTADPFDFITGLGFQAPDKLLLGTTDGNLWQADFSGNLLVGPITFPGIADLEGVSQLDSNRIAVAPYDTGTVMFLDGNLNLLVGQDRSDLLGFGLSIPFGVAWNSDTNRHLVAFPGDVSATSVGPQVISLAPSLGTENRVVNLTLTGVAFPRALAYLSEEHRIAVSQVNCFPNCTINLYDNSGNLVGKVPAPLGFGLPAMDFIPTRNLFVARSNGFLPTTLLFFDRTGALVNSIDFSSIGIDAIRGVAFFNPSDPSGGEFLLVSSLVQHTMYVVDFTGSPREKFDYRATLRVVDAQDVGLITTGPLAGAFSLVAPDTSEIVVFRLP